MEYKERLASRRAWVERLERRHIQAGNARFLVFAAGAWLGWLAFGRDALSGWWLAVPLVAFIALLIWHERILRERSLARRAVRYYELGIARLEDRWAGLGPSGARYLDPSHPYAEDLDLFGKGGLFELLSVARTRAGENTLAQWLLTPASAEIVLARQAAVEELRPKLDLREELALLGEDAAITGEPEKLIAWAEDAPALRSGPARMAAAGLSFVMLCTAIWWAWDSTSGSRAALVAILAINTAFGFRFRQRVLRVLGRLGDGAHDLALLSTVLARLEREQFTSPLLTQLRVDLETTPAASRRIASLNRLKDFNDSRDNWLLKIVGPPLLYGVHLAFASEAWRTASGPHVRRWIAALGEFEALSAFAGYAYERPSDSFPTIVPGEACFEAEGLGHPLLPETRCVRNDLKLGSGPRLMVVSGSNMSGKSTLLRSAGVSAVMAMAGAPVRARSLRLSPVVVGASIRSTDSLQDGKSRFYAEITRLRKLVDLASGDRPLLFLIDEILSGTNSHDRRIGAEAVVRGLVERGAIGLMTTHDLALTEIAASLTERAENVHFEDHLENGQITFDYVMRPGVVTKSNALELMRSVGLDV